MYSSYLFNLPTGFKLKADFLNFFKTMFKTLGSLTYQYRAIDAVPLGIAPTEYIVNSQREFGANRILSGETKAQNKASNIDHRLENHNQASQKHTQKPKSLKQKTDKKTPSYHKLQDLITKNWTLSFERQEGDAQTEFDDKKPANTTKDAKKRDLQSQQPANASKNEQTAPAKDAKKDDATIKPIDLTNYKNNGFATQVKGSYLIGCLSMVMATLFVLM